MTISCSPVAALTITVSVVTAPVGEAQFKAIGAGQVMLGPVFVLTVTVVEQLATQPPASAARTLIWCRQAVNPFVREGSVPDGGLPAATMLVWTAVPSAVQITTNASPLALATLTETIATAPVGPAQFTVIGAAQLIVGAVLLLTVT